MSNADSRKALGKGLSALLPAKRQAPLSPAAPPSVPPAVHTGPLLIPIDDIDPNPSSPAPSSSRTPVRACPIHPRERDYPADRRPSFWTSVPINRR